MDVTVVFQHFLRLSNVKALVPAWWSQEKVSECVTFGLSSGPWSSLGGKLTKSELIGHDGDGVMPMQLGLLGE